MGRSLIRIKDFLLVDDLSVEFLCTTFHLERVPVINVARREHEIDDLAHFVADDVQLEAKEPSHRAFPPLWAMPSKFLPKSSHIENTSIILSSRNIAVVFIGFLALQKY